MFWLICYPHNSKYATDLFADASCTGSEQERFRFDSQICLTLLILMFAIMQNLRRQPCKAIYLSSDVAFHRFMVHGFAQDLDTILSTNGISTLLYDVFGNSSSSLISTLTRCSASMMICEIVDIFLSNRTTPPFRVYSLNLLYSSFGN